MEKMTLPISHRKSLSANSPPHPPMSRSRRSFLASAAGVSLGFAGLDRLLSARAAERPPAFPYGGRDDLVPDPEGILDLPKGFRYRILSRTGDKMADGFRVPGKPDGMAAFPAGKDRVVLVRNHEIGHSGFQMGPFADNTRLPDSFDPALCYDDGGEKGQPFVGGTSTLVYHLPSGKVEKQFLSLLGTDRNCAGGPTPWGSWITCEEPGDLTSEWGLHHGYCFDVPATTTPGLTKPEPLRAMGRFRHEAIAVDPATGTIYLTEDRNDGALYRFLPEKKNQPRAGGRLQALKVRDASGFDTRNWPDGGKKLPVKQRLPATWVDLEDVESPKDNLRHQAVEKGAAVFSRGEGMWYGAPEAVGEASVYWACTDGGEKFNGQIFRYFPGKNGTDGEVELHLEPNDSDLLTHADNITISPSGELVVCEDTKETNHLRIVTRDGEWFTLARGGKSEFAGACFSPDGRTLFVNMQHDGLTFAITGPFV